MASDRHRIEERHSCRGDTSTAETSVAFAQNARYIANGTRIASQTDVCRMAFIGAEADPASLLSILNGPENEVEARVVSHEELIEPFPRADTVVRVTINGCSCVLLRGPGLAGQASRDAHVAGPGYAFRRGLAAATVAFGGIRLLVQANSAAAKKRVRVARLGHFLRFGLMPDDRLIAIVPDE